MKTSDIQVGDSLLIREKRTHKGVPPHERQPLQVLYGKGTQITARREDGGSVTCSTTHFKKVPFKSMEDAKAN